jgi:hypothetical protein
MQNAPGRILMLLCSRGARLCGAAARLAYKQHIQQHRAACWQWHLQNNTASYHS